MKTILVRGWMPESIGIPQEEVSEKLVKEYCIRAGRYQTEGEALLSYAECMADWSTLRDADDSLEQFVEDAVNAILNRNYNWLEQHFV